MEIIPSIDLYSGKIVRLLQGKFADVTSYAVDPIMLAQTYQQQGAASLHIVDLNGAQNGVATQIDTILAIKAATQLQLQVGGGIRAADTAIGLLQQGIDRVVIGSMAVTNPSETQALLDTYGADKVMLALDTVVTTAPHVTINGWQHPTQYTLWEILANYSATNGLRVLCTDIAKDGALTGPNIALYRQCVTQYPNIKFIASGGVSQLSELIPLNNCGVAGVVIGKALYEKRFTLSEAINEVCVC